MLLMSSASARLAARSAAHSKTAFRKRRAVRIGDLGLSVGFLYLYVGRSTKISWYSVLLRAFRVLVRDAVTTLAPRLRKRRVECSARTHAAKLRSSEEGSCGSEAALKRKTG